MMSGHPLRSLLIGDTDHYPSEFIFGVAQGMTRLGHWHSSISIRNDFGTIVKRVREVQPEVIWGHMLLWSPRGEPHTIGLLGLCQEARRKGARVLIHDGDARVETRWPHDISHAVDLALCNHTADRSAWKIPQLRWPYFAFNQDVIAASNQDLVCDLVFAGRLSGGLYQERTDWITGLSAKLGDRFKVIGPGAPHTLFRTPELASSAAAVLGYGRPEAPGWTDVRVFQYPGAGAVLLHDDVQGYLTPMEHYIPIPRCAPAEVIVEALALAKETGPMIRSQAFAHVQNKHSSVSRVRQALREVGLREVGQ